MNWTEYFLNIAEQIKLRSKDKSTKIGVAIVGPDHELRSTGYNSFVRGIDDNNPERQQRPEKYYWFEHAERNAIYNAARIGVSTKGCTIYMSCGVACADCARAIIQAGISEIWCKADDPTPGKQSTLWDEHAKRSVIMFEEAGVKVNYYK